MQRQCEMYAPLYAYLHAFIVKRKRHVLTTSMTICVHLDGTARRWYRCILIAALICTLSGCPRMSTHYSDNSARPRATQCATMHGPIRTAREFSWVNESLAGSTSWAIYQRTALSECSNRRTEILLAVRPQLSVWFGVAKLNDQWLLIDV